MNISQAVFSLRKIATAVEWRLLAFLVLFVDVKLLFKLAAILLLFVLQPNVRFGFSLKNTRLPLFYPVVLITGVINFFIYRPSSAAGIAVFLTGAAGWLACIAAVHQVKLFTERTDTAVLHNTLQVFFILNMLFSAGNLLAILADIGMRNPFLYQGYFQKYFINTGDYIKGISFDTSTTNALINCFGIVYFLYRANYLLVIGCMLTLLMTASNFSNIIMLLVFAGLFILKSKREQKSIMAICTLLLVLFLAKISPQNESYVTDTIEKFVLRTHRPIVITQKIIPIRERPDSLLTPESRREKIATLFLDSLERNSRPANGFGAGLLSAPLLKKPTLPADSIHTAAFQWKRDTTLFQRQLLTYMDAKTGSHNRQYANNTPGKLLALKESVQFLNRHPGNIVTGIGMGNFSSKLAFRATGLHTAGSFPKQWQYCHPAFLDNHLSLYTFFLAKHADAHSIIHNPASVYDQLLTEYGLLGLLALPVFYVGFFLRHSKELSYGWPLLAILLAFFMVDYWFEQLSAVVLFELLLFVNIKENTPVIAKG